MPSDSSDSLPMHNVLVAESSAVAGGAHPVDQHAKDSALEPRTLNRRGVLADVKSGAPWGSDRNPTRPAFPAYEKAAPIFIDAEPLSRNVVGEAVGEFVTGVFIVAILCPVIWAFCLLIRYLGARFHL